MESAAGRNRRAHASSRRPGEPGFRARLAGKHRGELLQRRVPRERRAVPGARLPHRVGQLHDLGFSQGEPDYWGGDGHGNLAFSRRLWPLARPMPEFQSWGGEEKVFADKLQQHQAAVRERFGGLLHQWHPERPPVSAWPSF